MRKIILIGSGGSGKSTLAREMGKNSAIPLITSTAYYGVRTGKQFRLRNNARFNKHL